MKVTREMIGAAHDILLKKEMVLSADLLADIYMAMASRNSETESLRQKLANRVVEVSELKQEHINAVLDLCECERDRDELCMQVALLRGALHSVSLCEFNSMSSRQEMGRLSREALAATEPKP